MRLIHVTAILDKLFQRALLEIDALLALLAVHVVLHACWELGRGEELDWW